METLGDVGIMKGIDLQSIPGAQLKSTRSHLQVSSCQPLCEQGLSSKPPQIWQNLHVTSVAPASRACIPMESEAENQHGCALAVWINGF
jgi:hypothetical protein